MSLTQGIDRNDHENNLAKLRFANVKKIKTMTTEISTSLTMPSGEPVTGGHDNVQDDYPSHNVVVARAAKAVMEKDAQERIDRSEALERSELAAAEAASGVRVWHVQPAVHAGGACCTGERN